MRIIQEIKKRLPHRNGQKCQCQPFEDLYFFCPLIKEGKTYCSCSYTYPCFKGLKKSTSASTHEPVSRTFLLGSYEQLLFSQHNLIIYFTRIITTY